MEATRAGIIAQDEDPELRRHREEMLARRPWLRHVLVAAYVVAAVAIASVVVRALLG